MGNRTIWVKEFNVHITIFYCYIVYNSRVPLIVLRTSIKWSRHDVLNRKYTFFLLESKFLKATPDTQFITIFSPLGITHYSSKFPWSCCNLKTWTQGMEMFSLLMDCVFTKNVVTAVILLFTIQTTAWKSEFALRKVSASSYELPIFFKVLPTASQAGKPENLCRDPFILKNSSLGSASLEPIVTPRHMSKAHILKECS